MEMLENLSKRIKYCEDLKTDLISYSKKLKSVKSEYWDLLKNPDTAQNVCNYTQTNSISEAYLYEQKQIDEAMSANINEWYDAYFDAKRNCNHEIVIGIGSYGLCPFCSRYLKQTKIPDSLIIPGVVTDYTEEDLTKFRLRVVRLYNDNPTLTIEEIRNKLAKNISYLKPSRTRKRYENKKSSNA